MIPFVFVPFCKLFRLKLSNPAAGVATQKLSVKDTALTGTCIKDPVCRPFAKFRSIDGSCNNLQSPLMGRSVTQLGRYLAPQYDDGKKTLIK